MLHVLIRKKNKLKKTKLNKKLKHKLVTKFYLSKFIFLISTTTYLQFYVSNLYFNFLFHFVFYITIF